MKCLEKQNKKIRQLSNSKLNDINVNKTTFGLPIPDVNRARGLPQNLSAVVTNV